MENKNLAIIGCSKNKKKYKCQAQEMYSESDLFNKTLKFCINRYNTIKIMSAKYGLLDLDEQIDPYDIFLKKLPKIEKSILLNRVAEYLNASEYINIYFYTGKEYYKDLVHLLNNKVLFFPLDGMGIGQRLKFLSC